jgi:iron-sulfur cluster repair protein YtfE (RIC family)
LSTHIQREELVFYPACAKVKELKGYIAESYIEHKQIKALLRELSSISHQSERGRSKMRVLIRNVEHHVFEEENVLFPKVRASMKKGQFDKLSREIRVSRRPKAQKLAA